MGRKRGYEEGEPHDGFRGRVGVVKLRFPLGAFCNLNHGLAEPKISLPGKIEIQEKRKKIPSEVS